MLLRWWAQIAISSSTGFRISPGSWCRTSTPCCSMPRRSLSATRTPTLWKFRIGFATISVLSIWCASAIKGVAMASTAAFAGKPAQVGDERDAEFIHLSLLRLFGWLEANDYKGYDTFDGLSAWVRPLAFGTKPLLTVLQQGVRRF